MSLIVQEKIWKNTFPFSVSIKKKCDDNKTITHKLRFIDSFRFMNVLSEDLVDNLPGNIFDSITKTITRSLYMMLEK